FEIQIRVCDSGRQLIDRGLARKRPRHPGNNGRWSADQDTQEYSSKWICPNRWIPSGRRIRRAQFPGKRRALHGRRFRPFDTFSQHPRGGPRRLQKNQPWDSDKERRFPNRPLWADRMHWAVWKPPLLGRSKQPFMITDAADRY